MCSKTLFVKSNNSYNDSSVVKVPAVLAFCVGVALLTEPVDEAGRGVGEGKELTMTDLVRA